MSDTLFHIGTSVQGIDNSEVLGLNAIVFDTVTGQYKLGDGINSFANRPAVAFGTKEVVIPLTGFTHTLWATRTLLKPAATLAAGTFVLPAAPVDNMRIVITSSNTVTAVTWTIPSGQTMVYQPTTLTTAAPISLIWDAATAAWYQAE